MLIVCGIVLMTAAFSGCTDVNTKGDGDSVSATAEEPSPTPSVSNQALYKQITDPAVIKGAYDKDINLYRIPASVLGAPYKETSEGKMWKNVAGFKKYIEYDGDDGRVNNIEFEHKDGHLIHLIDKKKNDKKIDGIWAKINEEEILIQ